MSFVIRAALFLFAAAFAVNSAVVRTQYSLENAKDLFNDFMVKHNKKYNADEIEYKFEVFKQNLERFNKLNSDPNEVNEYVITKFADLTQEEVQKLMGFKRREIPPSTCTAQDGEIDMDGVPSSFDWRKHNGVTSVKDQGSCGSCWAFSAIGSIESLYMIKKQQNLDLSEQQLVDCDTGSEGCGGGWMDQALKYVAENGVEANSAYPYISGHNNNTHQCTFDQSKVVAKISGCNSYQTSEDELVGVLFKNGPLSIGIDASSLSHMNTTNVLDIPCGQIDHGVLLVGYGEDAGTPYWIVKNSWGADWGEREGFFYLKRGSNAACILGEVNGPVL